MSVCIRNEFHDSSQITSKGVSERVKFVPGMAIATPYYYYYYYYYYY